MSIWAMSSGLAEERERPFGDEVGHLVGDEVAAAGDELDLHVVGVVLVAGVELGTQGGVVGAEEESGGDGEAGVGVAAAEDRRRLVELEDAVHLDAGAGTIG